MPVLKTVVDERLKAIFKGQAKIRKVSESDLLRFFVLDGLKKSPKQTASIEADPEDTETDRMTVRMPAFVKKAVASRAKTKSMSPSRWASALIQTHLMRDPVMTDTEIEALRSSNRELAALGRNLNQIARALNDNFTETDKLKLQLIEALQASVKGNREAVRALIRASREGWGAEAE